jgi:hypothetical protein
MEAHSMRVGDGPGTAAGLTDTAPEVEAMVIAGYQAMPGWRKLDQVRRLNHLGLALALADIQARHPTADERECLLRLAARCMDPAILARLCGWDVSVEGL